MNKGWAETVEDIKANAELGAQAISRIPSSSEGNAMTTIEFIRGGLEQSAA